MSTADTYAEPPSPQPREFTERPGSDRAPLPRKDRQRQALRRLSRQLSEDELSSPALKTIVDLLDTLEEENEELREFRDEFYARDKEVAVLQERLREATAREIVLGPTVGVALILGYAPSLRQSQPTGLIALVAGALLLVGSVAGWLAWKPRTRVPVSRQAGKRRRQRSRLQ